MKTCKDCLHCKVCPWDDGGSNPDNCANFSDRSEYLHLKGKIGDRIYYPWVFYEHCGIATNEIESIKLYVNDKPLYIVKDWESDIPMQGTFTNEDFDSVIYLDYEKAERKLKEIEEALK